jgi:hypothetical protein
VTPDEIFLGQSKTKRGLGCESASLDTMTGDFHAWMLKESRQWLSLGVGAPELRPCRESPRI